MSGLQWTPGVEVIPQYKESPPCTKVLWCQNQHYDYCACVVCVRHQGASIHVKDKKNLMPLHCACWKGQLEAVEFLLSYGAQACASDVSLKTALHWAVQFDHFNVLHTLLKVSVTFTVHLKYFPDAKCCRLLNTFSNIQQFLLLDYQCKNRAEFWTFFSLSQILGAGLPRLIPILSPLTRGTSSGKSFVMILSLTRKL